MNSFGTYLRNLRESHGLPLRKVAAQLDIDTSILSKIERGERTAHLKMLPVLSSLFSVSEKEMQVHFLENEILSRYGNMPFLKESLKEVIKSL